TAAGLVETLAEDALLVVGAAGGSWLQRQLLGPGHRLLVNAPGGAVVVRDAPRRAFHRMVDAAGFGVGPGMAVRDAVQVVHHASVPVADGGKLVGIFRPAATHDESATVAEVMETPVSIRVDEPLEAASALRRFLEGGPVPVVDREADLAGVVL
ncbi:MAG: hypothetical protein R3290_07695, partial [Acidimicrobiia bacterium]|nr:hypothetical protein [Acidimicrobiia bacterium]